MMTPLLLLSVFAARSVRRILPFNERFRRGRSGLERRLLPSPFPASRIGHSSEVTIPDLGIQRLRSAFRDGGDACDGWARRPWTSVGLAEAFLPQWERE
jgi:hypothetical protein